MSPICCQFQGSNLEHNLIKPDVVAKWSKIQNTTDPEELANTPEFEEITKCDLLLSSMYQCGATVVYKMNSVYDYIDSNSKSSKTMAKVINLDLVSTLSQRTTILDSRTV